MTGVQALIQEGAVLPLTDSLALQDFNCQRYASLALANLTSFLKSQVSTCSRGDCTDGYAAERGRQLCGEASAGPTGG